MDPFVSDVKKIRDRAKTQIEKGAVTQGYQGDAEQVCKVLNEALSPP